MVRYLHELVPLLEAAYRIRDSFFKEGNARGYHETLEDIRDLEKEIVESAIQEHTYFEGGSMTDLEVYNEWKELDDYFHVGSDEWARDDEAYEQHCRKCERYAYLRSEIYRRFKERAEKEAK